MDDPTCSESEESDTSSESSTEAAEHNCRKKRRLSRYENYIHGTARGVYQLRSKDLETAMDLSPTVKGVCSTCASGLAGIASGFKKLKHEGTELKKRKTKMLTHPEREHYRDINAQNEWLRGNVFDSMGNYLFCHSCIRRHLNAAHNSLHDNKISNEKSFNSPLLKC